MPLLRFFFFRRSRENLKFQLWSSVEQIVQSKWRMNQSLITKSQGSQKAFQTNKLIHWLRKLNILNSLEIWFSWIDIFRISFGNLNDTDYDCCCWRGRSLEINLSLPRVIETSWSNVFQGYQFWSTDQPWFQSFKIDLEETSQDCH